MISQLMGKLETSANRCHTSGIKDQFSTSFGWRGLLDLHWLQWYGNLLIIKWFLRLLGDFKRKLHQWLSAVHVWKGISLFALHCLYSENKHEGLAFYGQGTQAAHVHPGSPAVLLYLQLSSEEPVCSSVFLLGRGNESLCFVSEQGDIFWDGDFLTGPGTQSWN